MNYTYSKPLDFDGKERTDYIVRSDGAWIPTDLANKDYAAYLADPTGTNPPTTPLATPTA